VLKHIMKTYDGVKVILQDLKYINTVIDFFDIIRRPVLFYEIASSSIDWAQLKGLSA
jgi:hypothetical protein